MFFTASAVLLPYEPGSGRKPQFCLLSRHKNNRYIPRPITSQMVTWLMIQYYRIFGPTGCQPTVRAIFSKPSFGITAKMSQFICFSRQFRC